MNKEALVTALKLGEDDDIEFKNGRGGIDKSFMQSVSAFGNTLGGVIVCGVESKDREKTHTAIGLADPARYKQDMWNALHNPNVVNHCPCGHKDNIWITSVGGESLVCVRVPPADRKYRPVYIPDNPMTGTYKRRGSGDYRCAEEEVLQMMRDAAGDPQDSTVIADTTMANEDAGTLVAYRNLFASKKPTHPFLLLDDKELLKKLGAWKEDRRRKVEGLTLAGALMFGSADTVTDVAQTLQLDYYARAQDDPNIRYDDRVTSDDGTWTPNLFTFFFMAYPRLVDGLRVPFAIGENAMREGDTPSHRALREATVNAIVHTDFRSSGAIRIAKRPDAFIFQNPGRSLTPVSRIIAARHAGEDLTNVRNPSLVRMFFMLGLAERQGSGYPTIFRAWDEGKRHSPRIEEDLDLNLTTVTLPLLGPISPMVEQRLQEIVGPEYALLTSLDKDILVEAYQYGETSNESLQFSHKLHPRDIGARLKTLADRGWLRREGSGGRGRTYRFAGKTKNGLFEGLERPQGGAPTPKGGAPTPTDELMVLAARVRERPRADRTLVETVILELCRGRFLTPQEIGELIGRKSVAKLRENYLPPWWLMAGCSDATPTCPHIHYRHTGRQAPKTSCS